MAEAYADDTELGCASCKVCVCKGLAKGVREDGSSHKEDVIKELHEDRVMAKGDAPGGRLFSVDHGTGLPVLVYTGYRGYPNIRLAGLDLEWGESLTFG